MHTLLIELEGPMQSWGYRSRFSIRDTGLEPSKSGVIGLIAAALGRLRSDDISDLAGLRFGVRVEREGIIKKEFQTAQNIIRAEGGSGSNQIAYKKYLANARFIAAVSGNVELLSAIKTALLNPYFTQYLGRRSYPPSVPVINPVYTNPAPGSLESVLHSHPHAIITSNKYSPDTYPVTLRIVRDALPGEESVTMDFRRDIPVSFARKEYHIRTVITEWVTFSESSRV